ncbi:MAG TPA: hypothetical protein VNV82_10975 [Bryobacteraceae bacterium]|jgi:hypothetical protein|nr:hypothetical protein [Bryobacteraceae bacterium]
MANIIKLSGTVEEGLMPAEKIARIEVADGDIEEVSVSVNDISADNRLMASEIGRQGERVLVELPRESASGRWRVWVNAATVGA